MIGIELVKDQEEKVPLSEKETFKIVLDIAALGLIVYYRPTVIGLFPTLIIDEQVADAIVSILDKALDTSISANVARKARLVEEFTASKLSLGS